MQHFLKNTETADTTDTTEGFIRKRKRRYRYFFGGIGGVGSFGVLHAHIRNISDSNERPQTVALLPFLQNKLL